MFDDLLDGYETKKPESTEVVVGIDLGTTNSVIAVMDKGEPVVIENKQGLRVHPSAVSWLPSGDRVEGLSARLRRVVDPQNTVTSAKRLIGQRYSSDNAKHIAEQLPYTLSAGANDECLIATREGDISVAQVSSYVLKHLKRLAEESLLTAVTHCVVTVPAHFSDAQRSATRSAAEQAGMRVLRVLNEPTAAALAYGQKRKLNHRIAIFDFGGGTFDVTVLAVRSKLYEVIATGGDPFLGGDDIDTCLLGDMANKFLALHRMDPRQDPLSLARLNVAAEQIKMKLSSDTQLSATLSEIGRGPGGEALGLDVNLSRDNFNALIKPLVDKAMAVTEGVLQDARISPSDIDEVILVGGSSRIPLIRQRVAKLFGKEPKMDQNPMEVVALGAAIQGHHLLNPSDEASVLMDVTPHSLRVGTVGGYSKVLINKNETVPCEGVASFNPGRDNQNKIRVRVAQGEEEKFEDNVEIGSLELGDLPEDATEKLIVKIAFTIDADGILQVSARETTTGHATKATLTLVGHNEAR